MREGWTEAEERELAKLTQTAEGLEAQADRINDLADKKEKLDTIKARTAEVARR